MIHLGLVGHPLGHSPSPRIHEAALRACGLEGDYSLFPIHPLDDRGLRELMNRVRSGKLTGLNVTLPHKQNVVPLLDELAPVAQAVGAVNTIHYKDDKLIGHNTDADGFLLDLKSWIGSRKPENEDQKSALVLGAGGAARAVVHALSKDGWQVTVAARRIEQARELAARCMNVNAVEFDLKHGLPDDLQLIVNTTPIGMTPDTQRSPLPETFPFPNAVIYDLVYNPLETRLVRTARAAGLSATTGLGMLIEQAALAFEIWTGHRPPREILLGAVNRIALR